MRRWNTPTGLVIICVAVVVIIVLLNTYAFGDAPITSPIPTIRP